MPIQRHPHLCTAVAASLLLASAMAANATPYSYSGALTVSDPTFNRPLTTTSLSAVGTNTRYDVQSFSLTLASSVALAVTAAAFAPNTADDSFLALYQGAFNPAAPLTNLIAVDDDSGPGALSLIASISLQAGTTYVLVTTTFFNDALGSYSDSITPVNPLSVVVPLPVPEPAAWAMALAGLGWLLATRARRV